MERYEKLRISMRYWLQGRVDADPKWLVAMRAFNMAEDYHDGVRKDGKTAEFEHQLSIMSYLRTMQHSLRHPIDTFVAAALHDVREDYGVSHETLFALFGQDSPQGVYAVKRLTKKFRGKKSAPEVYFEACTNDVIASVVKGADRIHNIQSMPGVFTVDKQLQYMQEVRDYFLPMLKRARRLFPDQEPVYENMKLILVSQLQLLEMMPYDKA